MTPRKVEEVNILGFSVNLELLGIFIALLPIGAYLGIRLKGLTVWSGAGTIVIAYLMVSMRHEMDFEEEGTEEVEDAEENASIRR